MKILVLTGSPRKKGNSAVLADNFIKGAKEAGHTVVRFDAGLKNVHPCIACEKCHKAGGSCIFKDDFDFVREHMADADVVVFATPVYYFGISAQLKATIDRFYAIEDIMKVKKSVLLLSLADTNATTALPTIANYQSIIGYLGWQDAGHVIASGVWPVDAVNDTDYPQQAYQLGKNISL